MKLSEKQIENGILNYLGWRRIFAWKNQSVGIYDVAKGVYRKPRSPHHKKGVSDIIGIYKNRPLFIEVKRPGGKVSDEQLLFLTEAAKNGAIAILATSVDDVAKELDFFDKAHKDVGA